VNQKLLKYYLAFEKGGMSNEDAAPRIGELRAEQTRLQRMSDVTLALLEHSDLQTIDAKQLLDCVGDLKGLLLKGTLAEQDTTCDREVLSIKQNGSPSWIRTNNLAVNSRPLYR
jgi:hypothetical protein